MVLNRLRYLLNYIKAFRQIQPLSAYDLLKYLLNMLGLCTIPVLRRIFLLRRRYPQILPFDFVVKIPSLNNCLFYVPRGKDGAILFGFIRKMPNYEPKTRALLNSILCPGDVFIDIGAHIGYYTITMSRRVGSTGRVIAVEPCLGKYLRMNVQLNRLENVFISEKAAYHSKGCIRLAVGGSLCGRIYPSESYPILSWKLVQAAPLDDIFAESGCPLKSIKALKVDVEGAEYDVLAGATKTLERTEYVIFEAWDRNFKNVSACIELLRLKGFRVSVLERFNGYANLLAARAPNAQNVRY